MVNGNPAVIPVTAIVTPTASTIIQTPVDPAYAAVYQHIPHFISAPVSAQPWSALSSVSVPVVNQPAFDLPDVFYQPSNPTTVFNLTFSPDTSGLQPDTTTAAVPVIQLSSDSEIEFNISPEIEKIETNPRTTVSNSSSQASPDVTERQPQHLSSPSLISTGNEYFAEIGIVNSSTSALQSSKPESRPESETTVSASVTEFLSSNRPPIGVILRLNRRNPAASTTSE